jgi:hypothetical protein
MATPSGHTLFTEALRVIGRAIEAHKDASPWREVVARTSGLDRPLVFGVAIYEDEPDRVVDHYSIRVHEGRFEVVERGRLEPEIDWQVSVDHLRNVVAKPARYVADPGRLELDWLVQRIGIGPRARRPSGWRAGRVRRPS